MARVFLTTTGNNSVVANSHDDFLRMEESAKWDRFGKHKMVAGPAQADVILFVGALESDVWDVRRSDLAKAYADRVFLYYSEDFIFPFLPGIYPSLRGRDDFLRRAQGGGYTAVLHVPLGAEPFNPSCKHLYSFFGSFKTHPLRQRLGAIADCPRALVVDTSATLDRQLGGSHAPGPHREEYARAMAESKFVLCPRGRGAASWRLFECLKAGRVPVVISDEWVPPPVEPDWDGFSVRVRERNVEAIPALLEEYEGSAPEMAARARSVYEQWYTRDAFFHRTVEQCLMIIRERRLPEPLGRYAALLPLALPRNLRRFVLPRAKRKVVEAVRGVLPPRSA